jgi:putative membrane protein
VADVVVTADNIDIDLARFAQTRSKNAEVLKFAGTMITDHSAVNAKATALAKKLGVTPENNAVSQSLLAGAKTARAASSPCRGRRSMRLTSRVRWRSIRRSSTPWIPS